MSGYPRNLERRLEIRKKDKAFRALGEENNLIDFSSNDYLGFSSSEKIFDAAEEILNVHNLRKNGATGSRLLSGNHNLYAVAEDYLKNFHNTEAALIYNSGYDANIGLFSSVPQRGDFIFYDELVHASIRDGIKMSNAKSYSFRHNDLEDLKRKISRLEMANFNFFIVTESVFSMDGDIPDLKSLANYTSEKNFFLIVDEAHAVAVFGRKGEGLIQDLGLEKDIFARIVTFGKGMGCHGAAILGSNTLKDYLINFCRSFIFTTALPPHAVATILSAYQNLANIGLENLQQLKSNIEYFKGQLKIQDLETSFIASNSAIQSCIIPGNAEVKSAAENLQKNGFSVKPILSPTVPKGKERLRFCLHSFNSEEEIQKVLKSLSEII
ncbi:aminotransferase class I/II-fold pyridoxal phosphate-dependent enzyme [Autumnicola psychrophila]|uniref:Pyridoxal phosphate-dependent aminotransferase family protein n=1 Tax=Autumnicola psychrophila TaxID=3075592 RepID=A0ABU3DW83_9FLAO|nr:pyridoxal phosphate-dependent aminotransferase family protein [Zunongwangia sp. F225]MDT0687960.1 pyridoxal phosphate-dependent aminotransferase family protein [Zunongwangia sp. F225]